MCLVFVFQFLSSAITHLNSRCLSQAVRNSGAVDFDTEVISTYFTEGFGAVMQVPELTGTHARVESSTQQSCHSSSQAVLALCRVPAG